MANELQIRLSADISALTSALNKAKNTIKSFESETAKESEKGNVGFKRKIGLIESLTNKAKALRTALSQATNEQQVERYNQELEQTSKELTRLNALGRSVTANLGSTAGGFSNLARASGSANGVIQETGRILQDSPYAINNLGSVFNNLTRALELFTFEVKAAGSASKAASNIFASAVTPMNLTLLAVSALTAAFTAYQMGAFDGLFATEDLGKAAEEAAQKLDDYRDSLDAVTRASLEGAAQGQKEAQSFELLRSQAENANIPLKTRLEAVRDLQKQFPDYLGNLTKEQILTGNVGTSYEDLTAQIIATAKARAFSDQIAENSMKILTLEERAANRVNDILKARDEFAKAEESIYDVGEIEIIQKINDLTQQQLDDIAEIARLKEEEVNLTSQINTQIDQGAKFTEAEVIAVKDLNKAYDETLAKVQMVAQFQDDAAKRFSELAKGLKVDKQIVDVPIDINFIPEGGNQELGIIQKLRAEIESLNKLREVATDPSRLEAYNAQIVALQEQLQGLTSANQTLDESNKVIIDSFASLGAGIVSSLDISNNALRGFLATLVSAIPKIVGALLAQAAASKAAAAINNQANAQQAAGAAVVTAAEGAKGLGPIGIYALPVFIAGALALISGAFRKIGGGGSVPSGGGGSVGAPPQIFTNAPQSFSPNTGNVGSGSSSFNPSLKAEIGYDSLTFYLDQYKEGKSRS